MLRKAKPPEVAAHSILLLPPAYRQAAIKELHEDTHAGQQQTIKMANDRSGQALGETSISLSNLALYASESKSTNTSMSREDFFQDSP